MRKLLGTLSELINNKITILALGRPEGQDPSKANVSYQNRLSRLHPPSFFGRPALRRREERDEFSPRIESKTSQRKHSTVDGDQLLHLPEISGPV